MSEPKKHIDVEKLIQEKNPGLYRWIPGFLIRFLKRKIHQKDVNHTLHVNEGVKGFEFSKYVIDKFNISVEFKGTENIPKSGGAIFSINHPLGGLDAMALVTEFHKVRTDYKFVVNDLLMNLTNLKDMFVGVNKHGSNSKDALKDLNNLFASDQAVFVFPAGLVSRKKKGVIRDLDWKKTFITRAKKFERDVIPVHIEGGLTNFFYRLSNFRTAIGIKANIEMLYLVDEMYKQENKKITITFGKAIPYQTFDKSKKDIEWAQYVKSKVYDLQES